MTKLETEMEFVRADLSEIKVGQKAMERTLLDLTVAMERAAARAEVSELKFSAQLEKLPTKDDLWSWKIQWLAIGLAVVALIVGGIIGGLSIIKTG